MSIDLTGFGFTPTEGAAYHALVESGPLGGYGLAKALSIARANAYQALHGLVAKGAATRLEGRPERFRPVQPLALFAAIEQRAAGQLDALEAELTRQPQAGAPATISIAAPRALMDMALRTAARSTGPVLCVAPAGELAALAPAWHKRAAEDRRTELWCLGDPTPQGALPVAVQRLDAAAAEAYFSGPILGLSAEEAAMLAHLAPSSPAGFWTSDPVVRGAVRAALALLTR